MRDRRAKNWFWMERAVVKHHGAALGTVGMSVYAVLAMMADEETQSCYPSYQTIADYLGVSRNTAIKGIKMLVEAELIVVTRRPLTADGDATSNVYTLVSPPEPGSASFAPGSASFAPPHPNGAPRGSAGFALNKESGLNENQERQDSLTKKQRRAAQVALSRLPERQADFLRQQAVLSGMSIEETLWRLEDYECTKALREEP